MAPSPVTTAVRADGKVYDGAIAATGRFGEWQNVVAGDTLGVTGTMSFAGRNAGPKGHDGGGCGAGRRNYTPGSAVSGTTDIAPAIDRDVARHSAVIGRRRAMRQAAERGLGHVASGLFGFEDSRAMARIVPHIAIRRRSRR